MEIVVLGEVVRVERIPITGDGACLFNMLSMALHGTEEQSYSIRKSIVEYVVQNFERYSAFLIKAHYQAATNEDDTLLYNDVDNVTFSAMEYQVYMLRPYAYGTFVELTIASELFQRRFYVFEKRRGANMTFFHDVGEHHWPMTITVLSGARSAGHFELLRPISSTLIDSTNYFQEFPALSLLSEPVLVESDKKKKNVGKPVLE